MAQSIVEAPIRIDTSRKIIHVDMDAFYASIEEREHPAYKTQPLVIAHDPRQTGGRGVVTTANYVARQYGVHSAMPAAKALELCPKAVFKTPNFPLYRQVSDQIHEIFHEYTEKIEPIAFDEAYLDVTENKPQLHSAVELAHRLQREIWAKTHLTCSTGISYNKFIAKLASDYRKPAGVTIVLPQDAEAFLLREPIEKFRGVGKKTVPKMHDLGIQNGYDLFKQTEMDLIQHFGKLGYILYRRVRGSDNRPVEYLRERKSIGKERTFGPFLQSNDEVSAHLKQLAQMVSETMKSHQRHGKTLVLKLRYGDFVTITKRQTFAEFLPNDPETFYQYAEEIFEDVVDNHFDSGIRLLGITMTGLAPLAFENLSLPLYPNERT
ncbi:DNA polymerase IV [Lactiplantibacillus sp. WILCCON 0030]|uniref:DNA polymerase IV n=1 Tax=Lactiplantibacillus brownii TaxID=3069269 RepID=A0ABU1AA06_9LACO|nr:DNA polymerase IV [Lactiplantibacillus brownii]MDQ7937751.1 DNA polymerase IV [Lactiplantibacillus brownii]